MEYTEHREIVRQVYAALDEKGYSPTDQIMGYILTGDPTYITNHNAARRMISTVDRHDLLKDIVTAFFSTETLDI